MRQYDQKEVAAAPRTFAASARRICIGGCCQSSHARGNGYATYIRFLTASKLAEHRSDALPLRVPDCTQAVSRIRASHKAGDVGDDKAQAGSTDGTNPRPPWDMSVDLGTKQLFPSYINMVQSACRMCTHLFEDVCKHMLCVWPVPWGRPSIGLSTRTSCAKHVRECGEEVGRGVRLFRTL